MNCLKYLEKVWNRKEGRGDKDLKKRGGGGECKLGQVVGSLKRGAGAGTPLRTMGVKLALKMTVFSTKFSFWVTLLDSTSSSASVDESLPTLV